MHVVVVVVLMGLLYNLVNNIQWLHDLGICPMLPQLCCLYTSKKNCSHLPHPLLFLQFFTPLQISSEVQNFHIGFKGAVRMNEPLHFCDFCKSYWKSCTFVFEEAMQGPGKEAGDPLSTPFWWVESRLHLKQAGRRQCGGPRSRGIRLLAADLQWRVSSFQRLFVSLQSASDSTCITLSNGWATPWCTHMILWSIKYGVGLFPSRPGFSFHFSDRFSNQPWNKLLSASHPHKWEL